MGLWQGDIKMWLDLLYNLERELIRLIDELGVGIELMFKIVVFFVQVFD